MPKGESLVVDGVTCAMYTNKAGDPDIVNVGIGCGVPKALPGRIHSTGTPVKTEQSWTRRAQRGDSRFLAAANNIL